MKTQPSDGLYSVMEIFEIVENLFVCYHYYSWILEVDVFMTSWASICKPYPMIYDT